MKWRPLEAGGTRPLGRPVPGEVDPTTLPGAAPFYAYAVEENDLHLTLYFRFQDHCESDERRRLFIAEEPDAVYVALVFEDTFDPDDGIVRGWAGWTPDADSAHAMLERPLAGRQVIDAVRCEPAIQVWSEPDEAFFDGRYRPNP